MRNGTRSMYGILCSKVGRVDEQMQGPIATRCELTLSGGWSLLYPGEIWDYPLGGYKALLFRHFHQVHRWSWARPWGPKTVEGRAKK
jgi:hypothetical protein